MIEYIFTGGSINWRYEVRNDKLYLDKEITLTGFSGIEGIDWKVSQRYD